MTYTVLALRPIGRALSAASQPRARIRFVVPESRQAWTSRYRVHDPEIFDVAEGRALQTDLENNYVAEVGSTARFHSDILRRGDRCLLDKPFAGADIGAWAGCARRKAPANLLTEPWQETFATVRLH